MVILWNIATVKKVKRGELIGILIIEGGNVVTGEIHGGNHEIAVKWLIILLVIASLTTISMKNSITPTGGGGGYDHNLSGDVSSSITHSSDKPSSYSEVNGQHTLDNSTANKPLCKPQKLIMKSNHISTEEEYSIWKSTLVFFYNTCDLDFLPKIVLLSHSP